MPSELDGLRRLIDSLAERVYLQHELLQRRSLKRENGMSQFTTIVDLGSPYASTYTKLFCGRCEKITDEIKMFSQWHELGWRRRTDCHESLKNTCPECVAIMTAPAVPHPESTASPRIPGSKGTDPAWTESSAKEFMRAWEGTSVFSDPDVQPMEPIDAFLMGDVWIGNFYVANPKGLTHEQVYLRSMECSIVKNVSFGVDGRLVVEFKNEPDRKGTLRQACENFQQWLKPFAVVTYLEPIDAEYEVKRYEELYTTYNRPMKVKCSVCLQVEITAPLADLDTLGWRQHSIAGDGAVKDVCPFCIAKRGRENKFEPLISWPAKWLSPLAMPNAMIGGKCNMCSKEFMGSSKTAEKDGWSVWLDAATLPAGIQFLMRCDECMKKVWGVAPTPANAVEEALKRDGWTLCEDGTMKQPPSGKSPEFDKLFTRSIAEKSPKPPAVVAFETWLDMVEDVEACRNVCRQAQTELDDAKIKEQKAANALAPFYFPNEPRNASREGVVVMNGKAYRFTKWHMTDNETPQKITIERLETLSYSTTEKANADSVPKVE